MRQFLSDLFDEHTVVSRRSHPELARALQGLTARREIESVLPGVYALPGHREFPEIRVLALRHYDPNAILIGRAAARLSFWPGLEVETVTAAVRHRRVPQRGYLFIRRALPPDLVTEVDGVRHTVPALTALDLCDDLGGDAIDEVLRRRVATLAELRAALAAIPNQPGNKVRRQALLDSADEPWSGAERRFHALLREAQITGWRANVPVTVEGSTYYLDVAFRQIRLAIEIDGRHFHGDATFESDRWRQNALVLDGWRVLRFTWAMIDSYPEKVTGVVLKAIGARSPFRSTT